MPGSRSVSRYAGSSGVPSRLVSSTRGTGSSPRTSRSSASSTAARPGSFTYSLSTASSPPALTAYVWPPYPPVSGTALAAKSLMRPRLGHGLRLCGVNRPVRVELSEVETSRASRTYWDSAAAEYLAEHGDFLGDDRFIWCPEGVDEEAAQLLGPVRGKRVLEVGCGAAQCSRWLVSQGANVVAFDISVEQLRIARDLDARTGTTVRTVAADAGALPYRDSVFDTVCWAFRRAAVRGRRGYAAAQSRARPEARRPPGLLGDPPVPLDHAGRPVARRS